MKKAGVLLVALVFIIGWGSLLFAQEKAGKKDVPDREFMIYAARDGLFHVEAGKLAVQRGSSEGVKKFGQHAIDHHTQINDELAQLASKKGVTLPKKMNTKAREALDKVAKLSGPDFDKAYLEMEIKDHSRDLSAFQKEVKEGKDPDVKAWAAKTVSAIEEHLKMARDLSTMK
jgi:putative membrane protein